MRYHDCGCGERVKCEVCSKKIISTAESSPSRMVLHSWMGMQRPENSMRTPLEEGSRMPCWMQQYAMINQGKSRLLPRRGFGVPQDLTFVKIPVPSPVSDSGLKLFPTAAQQETEEEAALRNSRRARLRGDSRKKD